MCREEIAKQASSEVSMIPLRSEANTILTSQETSTAPTCREAVTDPEGFGLRMSGEDL